MALGISISQAHKRLGKWVYTILVLGITLFLLLKGIFWLALFVSVAGIALVLLVKRKATVRSYRYFYYLFLFLCVLCGSILLRVFFIEIYAIPSDSMEKTIQVGDVVLANKLYYGPRLPRSFYDIPLVNVAYFVMCRNSSELTQHTWNYKRLCGFHQIKRNDVLIFDAPWIGNKRPVIIKRCTALPGDTIQIKKSIVYINGSQIPFPGLSQHRYKIYSKNRSMLRKELWRLGVSFELREQYAVDALLTRSIYKDITALNLSDSISINNDSKKIPYPHIDSLGWTYSDYGPVVIPFQGMKVPLDSLTLKIYKNTFDYFEGVKITNRIGTWFVNEQPASHYTFKNNYFWMMGDNRHHSMDSRYWGFVPEECIIGKAVRILFSSGHEGFYWNRLLRNID